MREIITIDDEDENSGLAHDHGYCSSTFQYTHNLTNNTQTNASTCEDSGTHLDHSYARNPNTRETDYLHDPANQTKGNSTQNPSDNSYRGKGARAVAPLGDSRLQDGAVG